jgi:pimeloyl-ACP methyl ester carboxylesterase
VLSELNEKSGLRHIGASVARSGGPAWQYHCMKAFLVLILLLVSAADAAGGQYIRKQEGNDTVVVFVHGVVGDGTSTWTNPRTKAYWPKLMADDRDFAGASIYVYEYPSPKVGLTYNVNEVAEDLRLNIDIDKLLSHKDIIFLSHSMGGLVVRQYLLKYRQVVPKVKFLYFYATPTTGSPVATLVSVVSRNPQLGNMKPMRADEYLGNIQRDWLADPVLRALATYCAYEKLPTFSQVIVEQESATNLCNRPIDPIDANHIDIVKPESTKSKAYLAFKSAFLANVDDKSSGGLRVELQNIQQAVKSIGQLPRTAANEDVYCDTVGLSLIIGHKALSKTPILINSIAIDAKPFDPNQIKTGERCKIDSLSSRPPRHRGIQCLLDSCQGQRRHCTPD